MNPLSSLVRTWNTYKLLYSNKVYARMDEETLKKWRDCIPLWSRHLPHITVFKSQAWTTNIYRHGHLMTQDPVFWQQMSEIVQPIEKYSLHVGLIQAGLFNNPLPFIHFISTQEGERQITGEYAYLTATLQHGTHPALGEKLVRAGVTTYSDLALVCMVSGEETGPLNGRARDTRHYWKFLGLSEDEDDFDIHHIIECYTSMMALKPKIDTMALWVHAAFQARNQNMGLNIIKWTQFETAIRPQMEKALDWDLIGACHGFESSASSDRDRAIAFYMKENLLYMRDYKTPPQCTMEICDNKDPVALSILSLRRPSNPWAAHTIFEEIQQAQSMELESYSMEF